MLETRGLTSAAAAAAAGAAAGVYLAIYTRGLEIYGGFANRNDVV